MTATGCFITGTDTGIGKTHVACSLLQAGNAAGIKTVAMKPVACGCEPGPEGTFHRDALLLQQHASVAMDYELINPYPLLAPSSPHLAANQQHITIDPDLIRQRSQQLKAQADLLVIEGVGGWRVPINDRQTIADLARELELPVILVVGLRLGCLNHALLSAEAIVADRCRLAGWIANSLEPDIDHADKMAATLQTRITAPCLGSLPYRPNENARPEAGHLDIEAILAVLRQSGSP